MNDLPPDDRQEGRRRAIDGLLHTGFGIRTTSAGERALARLRAEAQTANAGERIGTAQIRAATNRVRSSNRPVSASHRRGPRAAPAPARRMAIVQGGLAAVTVVAVVLVLWLSGRDGGVDPRPQIVAVEGTVTVERSAGAVVVRDGMSITPGEILTTGVNSSVRVLWRDGTMLVCAANTRVRVGARDAGKHLHLHQGRVDAEVAPQPAESPFLVVSDDAEVTVLGTRLTCALREHAMQVTVAIGRVMVRRRHDGALATVDAGQQLAVARTGALQVGHIPVVAAPAIAAVGTGLYGQYFDDASLGVPVFGRIDRHLYFDFGRDSSPDPRIASGTYSIRWTGELQPKTSGRHTIICQVDDGVRIRINGKLLIEDWRIYEPRWLRAEIDLDAGRRYPIEVEYWQNTERAILQLWWQARGVPQEIIPTENLFPVKPVGAIDG